MTHIFNYPLILILALAFTIPFLNAMQEDIVPEPETITKEQYIKEIIREFVPTETLVSLIADYAVITPEEIEQANKNLEKAINTNDAVLASSAFNNGAYARGKTSEGVSFLVRSADNRCISITEMLLQHKANPNIRLINETPLIHEINDFETIQLLLRYKADINAVDDKGCNILFNATLLRLPQAQYAYAPPLIEYKANIDHTNIHKETPLHHATKKGWRPMIRILLEAKANPNATDDNGDTPLHCFVQMIVNKGRNRGPLQEEYGINKAISEAAITKLLLESNASLSPQNNNHKSVLDLCDSCNIALRSSIEDIYKRVLKSKKDEDNKTEIISVDFKRKPTKSQHPCLIS